MRDVKEYAIHAVVIGGYSALCFLFAYIATISWASGSLMLGLITTMGAILTGLCSLVADGHFRYWIEEAV